MKQIVLSAAIVISVFGVARADWRQFRGTKNTSLAIDARLPVEWNDSKNLAWRIDLPGRGPSSPIVVQGQVIVTCSSGVRQDRLHVLSFDAQTGQQQWHRQFWATGRTNTHPASANAAPTPASDGKYVYAFFSSNDLVCLDLAGNLRWYRGLGFDFPKSGNDVGMASSPAVLDDTVVVQVESQGESFVTAIDATTGQDRWHLDRDRIPNWSSPVAVRDGQGRSVVLFKSDQGLEARQIRSGERLWSYETSAGGIASLLVLNDVVYLPGDELTVLDIGKSGSTPELIWASNRVRPGSASPIVYGGRVLALGSSILTCADVATGEIQWKLRLQGDFWSTPVLAGGHLYCINLDGLAQVVRVGDEGEVVGTSEFGETIQCSPAVAGNAMFVRSDRHLWKIAAP